MTNEKKQLKKAYKKVKRKYVTPWKFLTILSLILSLIAGILIPVLGMFDNALALFVGGSFYELENADENAIYYEMDFDSEDEMIAHGSNVIRQVAAEGAVLLLNENNALPLASGSKVSCFSTSSVSLVYGGAGSASTDTSRADSLKTALEKTGFAVNETLWNFYTEGAGSKYRRIEGGLMPVVPETGEAPWSVYTEEVKASVSGYGDAAIVVLSRTGAEQYDLTCTEYNYLALDENERALLENLCAMKENGKISKIVVLLNAANAIQMDFLKDYDIDACLWMGILGESGINAAADILAGNVNPSGSLADTYCYNNYSAPSMWNFVPLSYDAEKGAIPSSATKYSVYQEGIYVGYKYYETRYEDSVMGTGNAGNFDYEATVAFPFGYGLSYTEFAYNDMAVNYNAESDQYEINVTITNTGDRAGKETVQIYVQAPYTQYDIDNGVEKVSVSLVGFGKTELLEPGASETLTIPVNRRDLTSFDAYGAGTYILDAGDYYLTAATDAHNAVNNILAGKGYAVDGNAALTYHWTEDELDTTTYAVSANGTAITNQLSVADPNLYEGSNNDITWLSRSDWQGTFPTDAVKIALTDRMIADLQNGQYDPADYEAMTMPTLGADNGLTVYDMMGKSYDDPDWEKLLDQLTFDEMVSMIGDAFHYRTAVESVQAPGGRDENGPQGLTSDKVEGKPPANALTSSDVIAATFNTELLYELGNIVGNNCLNAGVDALYGPGSNIHRTPYGGRNFEYYSEDGYLSGVMTANAVRGIQDKGVDVLIKHFALNDSETDRLGIGVWLNEQAAREIYLKAFQAAFEEADANGVMIAYTRWGTTWSGGVRGLMTGILREEWGNQGWSITDNIIVDYITGTDGVLAGTTAYDSMMPTVVNELQGYENDPVMVNAMRVACHHNLYALANSAAMNGVGENTEVKITEHYVIGIMHIVTKVFCIVLFGNTALWYSGNRKMKQSIEYQEYKYHN